MLEDIFLKYANCSDLKNEPDTFKEILQVFIDSGVQLSGDLHDLIIQTIDRFKELLNCTDYDTAFVAYENMLMPKKYVEGDNYKATSIEVAFESIYGFMDYDGEDVCEIQSPSPYCAHRWEIPLFSKELLVGNERLKCYECDQRYFIELLDSVVAGEPYSEILDGHLYSLLYEAYSQMDLTVGVEKLEKGSKDEVFKKDIRFAPRHLTEAAIGIERKHYKGIFAALFLETIVIYGLVEWLMANDRRKLMRCEECSRFHAKKTIRPAKYCSDKCRLAKHNRDRIQSGKNREYKRKKRKEGAKESYYG
jgi:hypothetical protein